MLHYALKLNRTLDDRYGEGDALNNIADALLGLGRAEEALDWLRQAYQLNIDLKYAEGIGYTAFWFGRCYMALARHAEAVESFTEALASYQASASRPRQALTLRFLARAQAGTVDPARARASFSGAATIYAELGEFEQATEVRAECTAVIGDV